ncbi:glycosyltransferase family 4 protein [Jeotgalibacillus sp. JSM ZJ347]|uniref:glycosyltransferase family 4 protein n=1 Tax=Jeotgalibacillus sp. JSM ZJ347 TaxID=3342117 RepID=UPI0035A9546F
MKILLTTANDYPHLGGLSTHMTTLKAGLESRGHEVDILSFTDVPKKTQYLTARGPSFVLNKVSKGVGYHWTLKRRRDFLVKLIEANKHKGYHIINAQDAFATLASLKSGLPVVSTVHGYLTREGISRGAVAEGSKSAEEMFRAEVLSFKGTRAVITVDTRIKDYVKEVAGVDGHMIKNFIDVEGFKPETERRSEYREKYGFGEDEKIFFVPRRLTAKNGVTYPIRSLPAVLEEHPEAKVVFAGTGEALEEMKRLIDEHNLHDNVKLLGAVDHSVMKEYYALSDVVLVPSVHSAGVEEATSISALEAMGSGVPLIACAVGGLKEIVDHGVDGLLVPDQDVEALSEAMIELLDNPDYGQTLAGRARQKIVDEYSHFAAAEKFEKIYKDAY